MKQGKETLWWFSVYLGAKEHSVSEFTIMCKVSQRVKHCLSACVWGLTQEAGGSRASHFLALFKEEEDEEEESSRMWPEPWAPAKSTPASPPPTPHCTMAASLLKFHVIGYQAWIFVLTQCPGSGACCRRDTLCKLKLEKLLFSLASKKKRGGGGCHPSFLHQSKEGLFSSAGLFPLWKKRGRIRKHIE